MRPYAAGYRIDLVPGSLSIESRVLCPFAVCDISVIAPLGNLAFVKDILQACSASNAARWRQLDERSIKRADVVLVGMRRKGQQQTAGTVSPPGRRSLTCS